MNHYYKKYKVAVNDLGMSDAVLEGDRLVLIKGHPSNELPAPSWDWSVGTTSKTKRFRIKQDKKLWALIKLCS